MRTISLKIPDSLHERVAIAARQVGMNRSEFARTALEAYLVRNTDRPVTCAELASQFQGVVAGSPDLSSNPEYLDDLGR